MQGSVTEKKDMEKFFSKIRESWGAGAPQEGSCVVGGSGVVQRRGGGGQPPRGGAWATSKAQRWGGYGLGNLHVLCSAGVDAGEDSAILETNLLGTVYTVEALASFVGASPQSGEIKEEQKDGVGGTKHRKNS